MKDVIIRSDRLTVHANALGAELKGVEMDGLEYLWQGDVDSYTRTSPTLFPIVGRFLSDTYYVGDRPMACSSMGSSWTAISGAQAVPQTGWSFSWKQMSVRANPIHLTLP